MRSSGLGMVCINIFFEKQLESVGIWLELLL